MDALTRRGWIRKKKSTHTIYDKDGLGIAIYDDHVNMMDEYGDGVQLQNGDLKALFSVVFKGVLK